MRTKQLELLVLSLAVLLAVGYTIVRFSGSSADTARLMNIFLASGFAIYVGYVYIVQLRDRRMIDGLTEKNNELKHKVAEREHQIQSQKEKISGLESDLNNLEDEKSDLEAKFEKAQKDWAAERSKLQEKLSD